MFEGSDWTSRYTKRVIRCDLRLRYWPILRLFTRCRCSPWATCDPASAPGHSCSCLHAGLLAPIDRDNNLIKQALLPIEGKKLGIGALMRKLLDGRHLLVPHYGLCMNILAVLDGSACRPLKLWLGRNGRQRDRKQRALGLATLIYIDCPVHTDRSSSLFRRHNSAIDIIQLVRTLSAGARWPRSLSGVTKVFLNQSLARSRSLNSETRLIQTHHAR